jgi:hypothetical protein
MWKTRIGHLYTVVGPSAWPAHVGEGGPPDRHTGFSQRPGVIDWDDRKRPWAGFHPVRHRFEGTALATLSMPGSSETVLAQDDAGRYCPKHADLWKVLGVNLHKLAGVLLREFAPGNAWPLPSFNPESPLLDWHLDRNNTLKAARHERMRLVELCTIISMCSAVGWVSTANPDSWIDHALDPKEGPKPDSAFVTFVNSLKHTFVVDSTVQRVGVFVNPSAVAFGHFLPAFARAGVRIVFSWGLESDIAASRLNVPACWHPTKSLVANAKNIVPVAPGATTARAQVAPCLPSSSTSTLQVDNSLDLGNARARHVRTYDSRTETVSDYWARRVAGRRSIMLGPSGEDGSVLANIATLEAQAKATWMPSDFNTVFM